MLSKFMLVNAFKSYRFQKLQSLTLFKDNALKFELTF